MTVAEVDALLYLPGHPRQQLLRALRIPALSPGWQASFKALLEGERGSGNAGLVATSPPPAWTGFRRLKVTGIERESDSVISISLEDPDGGPLPPARPGQYLTLRLQPDEQERSVLRNYSLSGPPGADYYRITVKREQRRRRQRLPAHPDRGWRPARDRSTARHLHPRPDPRARTADQRRHRGNPGPRHAPRAGDGAFRPRDLVAPRRTQQPRPLLRRRGPRAPRFAPKRADPRLLQPPTAQTTSKVATSTAPVVSPHRCSPNSSHRETPRHTSAGRHHSWRRSAPAWPRSASTPHRHPHRAVRARTRPDSRHRSNADADAPPTRRRTRKRPDDRVRAQQPRNPVERRLREPARTRRSMRRTRPLVVPHRRLPQLRDDAHRRHRRLQPRPSRTPRRRQRTHLLLTAARRRGARSVTRPPEGKAGPTHPCTATRASVFFSDGVFAITITLLVLEIRPPTDYRERAPRPGRAVAVPISPTPSRSCSSDRCGPTTTSCSITSARPTGRYCS